MVEQRHQLSGVSMTSETLSRVDRRRTDSGKNQKKNTKKGKKRRKIKMVAEIQGNGEALHAIAQIGWVREVLLGLFYYQITECR